MVERGAAAQYPSYFDLEKTKPNLQTYLSALNKSQPIVQSQFELVWNRWPRTVFFAKNISVPGISVNNIEISHAGFTINIPTHATYDNTEVTMTILADKEGFHYYDLRNMVLQTAHPLVACDPRATVGNPCVLCTEEDRLDVRLRNKPDDETHHHWVFHNFHPTGIGDVELTQDGSSFVEFELTGTFTHISYDCGHGADEPRRQREQERLEEERKAREAVDKLLGLGERLVAAEQGTGQEPIGEQPEEKYEPPEADHTNEETGEVELDDQDEKDAYEIVKDGGYSTATEMKEAIRDKLKQQYPDEDDEILDTRAEMAFDKARAYDKQESAKKGDSARDASPWRKRGSGDIGKVLVICGEKGGFVPRDADD